MIRTHALCRPPLLFALRAALDHFAEATPVVAIPRLVASQIDSFFALVPEGPLPALNRG